MSLIIPANTLSSGGYAVDNSLRFDDGSTDYLSGPNTNAGSTKTKFTFSAWIKRSFIGNADNLIMGKWASGNDRGHINFSDTPDDSLIMFEKTSGSTTTHLLTNRLFRDVSAWYHIVYIGDTTQGTAANRLKLYVNGVQETSFSTATYPNQDSNFQLQAVAKNFGIGSFAADNAGASPFSGYMAEIVYLDGVAGSVTDFGEFDEDSGIWKPIDVSGLTFGTNGFYLQFKESGTGTDANGMGADTSGNDNHFAVNNLTAIDQSTDTCTNNFATFNPLKFSFEDGAVRDATYSEGNLVALHHEAGHKCPSFSTIASNIGKWYCEVKWLAVNGSYTVNQYTGIVNIDAPVIKNWNTLGYFYRGDGTKFVVNTSSAYGATYTTGDIIGIAMDLDNSKLYFSKNGAWQNSGDPTSGATGTGAISIASSIYYAFMTEDYNNGQTSLNCGNPSFAISSSNTDGDGYGNFEYAVPSGYFALNTKNLAEYG